MICTASYRNSDPHTPASNPDNLPPSNGTILVNSYHLSVLAIFLMSAITFFSCLSNFPLSLSSSLERGEGERRGEEEDNEGQWRRRGGRGRRGVRREGEC